VISAVAEELLNFICLTGLILAVSVTCLWGASFWILLNWMKNMHVPGHKNSILIPLNNNLPTMETFETGQTKTATSSSPGGSNKSTTQNRKVK